MKIDLKHLTKSSYKALLTATFSCLVILVVSLTGAFKEVDYKILNFAFKLRDPIRVDSRIITVDIDDNALHTVGRWPWSWHIHAEAIKFLNLYGASLCALVDIDFSKEHAVSLSPEVSSKLQADITAGNTPAIALASDSLASAMSLGMPVFLTYEIKKTAHDPAYIKDIKDVLYGDVSSLKMLQAQGVSLPLPAIMKQAKGLGFNIPLSDSDGIVRRYPAVLDLNTQAVTSLGLTVAKHILNADNITLQKDKSLAIGSVSVPINDNAQLLVNWPGKYSESFVHIPFNMLSSFIAFEKAKAVAQKFPLNTLPDPSMLQNLIAKELTDLGFVTHQQIEYFSTLVFVSAVIEFYHLSTNYPINEIIQAIGLDPNDPFWLGIGYQIVLNNLAVSKFNTQNKPPDFEQLLIQSPLKDVDNQSKEYLQDSYEQLVFFLKNKQVSVARPLIFHESLVLKQGGKTIKISPAFFKDKFVFYGLTATGLTAQQPSPYEERHSMHDIAPAVLNTIITKQFLTQTPYIVDILIFASLAIVTSMLVFALTPFVGLLCLLGIWGVFFYTEWWLFDNFGMILPCSMSFASSGGAFLTASVFRFYEEQKERKRVRNMFSTMVSPEVLKMLEAKSQGINLTGQKVEATLFSSDVSGFTTISEGVTARELANILNLYLTPMSNIIMSYGGYIDKYEGDAIKADFGVPLADEGHAWKACFAALYQQEMLKVIQRMIFLKYGVNITARMGINTGIISAGNMGSVRRVQYTALGEAVTIAEELEPANKLFETWIAIGQRTYELAQGAIKVRYLNNMKLGHAHKSTQVYELQGWDKEAFLDYWRQRPVPDLFLHEFNTMPPEKALAWLDYLKSKPIASAMYELFIGTFSEIKDMAVEFMKLQNIISVHFVSSEIAKLQAGIDLSTASDTITKSMLKEAQVAPEDYKRQLLLCKAIAREAWLKLNPNDPDADKLTNLIDTVDKSIESLNKRISFAKPDDTVPYLMASHIKELITDKNIALMSEAQLVATHEQANTLLKAIQAKTSALATKIASSADEFHKFIAELCLTSSTQQQVNDLYQKGLQFYKAKQWQSAIEMFDEGLKILPSDGPCQKMKSHILKIKDTKLPEDWDSDWEA